MKKYFLFTGYLLVTAFLFIVADRVVGFVFDKYFFLKDDPKMEYVFNGGGADIAILGASRASHHYIPSIIEKELGMSCYNYGMDGLNIFNHYVVANHLVNSKINRPRVIVLEVAYIDLEDIPGYNGEKMNNLYPIYLIDKDVRAIINQEDKRLGFVLRWINCLRFNSRILTAFRNLISHPTDVGQQGYIPLNGEWKEERTISDKQGTSIYPNKEEYLIKLIDFCSEAGVTLLLFNSPDYSFYPSPPVWLNRLKTICQEKTVPFYDYSHDSLFMAHKEWFNEPFHLNDNGAKEYTTIIVNDIKDALSLAK